MRTTGDQIVCRGIVRVSLGYAVCTNSAFPMRSHTCAGLRYRAQESFCYIKFCDYTTMINKIASLPWRQKLLFMMFSYCVHIMILRVAAVPLIPKTSRRMKECK